MAQADIERRAGIRVQPHGVEALPHLEVADLITQPERVGAGRRGQMQEVRRHQGHALGAAQPLQEVGLQAFLEQREPGAGADVGAERHRDTEGQVAVEREQPAPERGVARWAVRYGGAAGGQELQLGVGGVHVVGEDAAGADQTVPVIALEVATSEQLPHLGDLRRVLVDVRGEPATRDVVVHGRARCQQLVGAGQREARRDRVPGAAVLVPSPRQLARLVVGAPRGRVQLRPQHPVTDDQAAGDPEPALGGLLEEGVDRRREMRPEHQRGRRARVDERRDELARDLPGVGDVLQPRLLREGAAIEPLQQRHAQRADGPHLRVVHVRVDEPGQQQAGAKVDDGLVVVLASKLRVRPALDDPAVDDEQPRVGVRLQRPAAERVVGGMQHLGAVQRHAISPAPWRCRPRRTARARTPAGGRPRRSRRSSPAPCR